MKTVAIIEDDAVMLKNISKEIEEAGFKVITARDGKSGLDLVLKEKPDLVLLDITLPAIDGIMILKILRKDEWGKNAKVLILSNHDDSERIASTLEEGVTGYMVKSSWKMEDVVSYVKEELGE